MTWRALWVSILLALVWTTVALVTTRATTPPATLRYYLAEMGSYNYRVQAHEAHVEGFCTVFIRDNVRIAAVCGQHTWTETVEAQ